MKKSIKTLSVLIILFSIIFGIIYFGNKKSIEYPMDSIRDAHSVKIISSVDESVFEKVSTDYDGKIYNFNSYFYLSPLKNTKVVSDSQWLYKLYFNYEDEDAMEIIVYQDYIKVNGINYKFADYESYLQRNLINTIDDYYNIIFKEYKTVN